MDDKKKGKVNHVENKDAINNKTAKKAEDTTKSTEKDKMKSNTVNKDGVKDSKEKPRSTGILQKLQSKQENVELMKKGRKKSVGNSDIVRQSAVELENMGLKSPDENGQLKEKEKINENKLKSEGKFKKPILKDNEKSQTPNKNKSSLKTVGKKESENTLTTKKPTFKLDGNINEEIGKTKSDGVAGLISKSTTQNLREDPKFTAMKAENEEKIKRMKLLFYKDVEEKKKQIDYIVSSGNYDTRNKNVPWYIILPNGKWKRTWDFLITFFLVYSLIILPIDVAWNFECFTNDQGKLIQTTYTICTVLFMLDIGFNFLTAVLNEKKKYIFNLQDIAYNYVFSKFAFDLLAAMPFDKFKAYDMSDCFNPGIPISKVYSLLNLVRFLKLGKYIAIVEDLLSKYITIIRLLKLFMTMLYLAHLIGNIYCACSVQAFKNLFPDCYQTSTLEDKNACFYKAFTTNFQAIYFYTLFVGIYFLVGNEVLGGDQWERIFAICITITQMALNSAIFGNVAVMISKMTLGLAPFVQEKIDIMREYMNFMKFKDEPLDRIENYHVEIWMKQRNMMYPEGFFDEMSSSLHKLILLDQWKANFFLESEFLFVSDSFFGDILPLLKPQIYMKKDSIINEGDISSGSIYFIGTTGKVSVKIGGEWVKNLFSGQFFGEVCVFLRSRRRTATVASLVNADFLTIDGDDFEKLLQDYPEDYEEIKIIAKKNLLSSMKLYPPKLFAKLVPKNEFKDYLLRKSIYLSNEEEDEEFVAESHQKKIVEMDKIKRPLENCGLYLELAKRNLTILNRMLKGDEEEININLN